MPLFVRSVTALALFAAALYVVAGLMLTYEVIARRFFISPTIWAAELSQMCLIWGTLIASPWCLRERRHIRITAVIERLSHSARLVADVIAMLAVAIFAAVVLVYGWDIFYDSFERGRTTGSMLNLPRWIVELAVPVGAAMLLIQALIEALRALRGEVVREGEHD